MTLPKCQQPNAFSRPPNDILPQNWMNCKGLGREKWFLIIWLLLWVLWVLLLPMVWGRAGRCSAWLKHNLVAAINFGFIRLLSVNGLWGLWVFIANQVDMNTCASQQTKSVATTITWQWQENYNKKKTYNAKRKFNGLQNANETIYKVERYSISYSSAFFHPSN